MNIHTLSKFISDLEEVVSESETAWLNKVVSSVQNTNNAYRSNQRNSIQVTFSELEGYKDRILKMLSRLAKQESHLDLLLPNFDLSFIEEQIVAYNEVEESSDLASSFQEFHQVASQTNSKITALVREVEKVKEFISPYLEKVNYEDDENALVSLIFNDLKTTTSLKELQKSLNKWNQVLPLYHRLTTGESSKEVKLVSVQNGCIDVIVNLDFDVALNLNQLFDTAIKCYFAYLTYKETLKTRIGGQVIEIENEEVKEAEEKLLEAHKKTIYTETRKCIEDQIHTKAKSENNVKSIASITDAVTTHVVKGNQYEILSLPHHEDEEEDEGSNKNEETIRESNKMSSELLEVYNKLDEKEKQFLIEHHEKEIKSLTSDSTASKKTKSKTKPTS